MHNPVHCRWNCQQAGLTLGCKRDHEKTCSMRLLSCVCGFTAILTEQVEHQKGCIEFHVRPLEKEIGRLCQLVGSMTADMSEMRGKIQSMEDNQL